MPCSFGRKVKLGYGYDDDLSCIYPFECNPQKITVEEKHYFYSWLSDVNSQINNLKGRLGLYLYDESLNYFNFLNKYENNEYYLIALRLVTESKECEGCDKYPETRNYISRIYYGIDIQFWMKKNKFLNKNIKKIKKLLKTVYDEKDLAKLTSEQLNTKFEVLMNYKEERWMTLKEIFEFFWDQQNIRKYQSAIRLDALSNPNSNTDNLTIENNNELGSLMYNLYIFIQKIKKIISKYYKFCDIKAENLNEMKNQLENSKNEFENMDENDLIGIYITVKKLFKCYQVYLDYIFINRLNVDDEDSETYKKWIEKLKILSKNIDIVQLKTDKFLNLKHSRTFCQKMEEIFEKIDYPYISECESENTNPESIKEEILKTIEKFDIIQTDEYIKAYQIGEKICHLCSRLSYFFGSIELIEEINEKHKSSEEKFKKLLKNIDRDFNFIEQAFKASKSYNLKAQNSNYLIRKCPSIFCHDNDEFRRWKCSICDEFMKINTVECDCGYKQFEDLNFYCENYGRQLLIEKLNQFNEEDENKNKQAKAFSDLLMSAPEQMLNDTLYMIKKYSISNEINEIIKIYFGIFKIQKIITVKESESQNAYNKIGYIKCIPVPQKLLIDNVKDVNYLMTKCPVSDECKDERFKFHLCFECKKLTKIKTLKCNCNEEKSFNSSHFMCDNEQHRSEFEEHVKKIIIQQLDEQKDNNEVQGLLMLVKNSNRIPLANILNLIKMLDLDGDTKQFIDDYMANSVI